MNQANFLVESVDGSKVNSDAVNLHWLSVTCPRHFLSFTHDLQAERQ